MPAKISKLSTTLTIAQHPVTLHSDEFDAGATKDEIIKKLKAGLNFSTGDREISATLGQIVEWAQEFEETFKLPDVFSDMTKTTEKALNDVTITISNLSVMVSTQKPAFHISMSITFDPDFYKELGIPQELTKWFTLDSMGVTLSYDKEPDRKDADKDTSQKSTT